MDKKENKSGLFSEFPPITTQQWEDVIKVDLKGGDYDKKLIWKTIDGLKLRPYYRAEDLKNLEFVNSLPCHSPFVRGNKKNNNNWEIRQDILTDNITQANKEAVSAIKKGAEAIGFNAQSVNSENDLSDLLKNIDLEKISIHFFTGKSYTALANLLLEVAKKQKIDPAKIKGSFNFDSITYFILHGKFYTTADNDFVECANLLSFVNKNLPEFKCININAQTYHNAGASSVQELAFCLSAANEYLAQLTSKGLTVDEISPKIQFTFAVGSNFFIEIAKLRAARLLWSKIVEQYNPKKEQGKAIAIHTVTSNWNKSVYDPNVNMLRTTTEAMAAAIGGCESMTVNPYDNTFKKSDEFSERIARNTQIILKHESHFNKIADPGSGSYYIENLTDSIACAAWKLFQLIEEKGGFVEVAKNKFIHEEIEKTCIQRDMDIAMRKTTILGTNQYPNLNEKMLDKMAPTMNPHELSSLRPYRGSQAFEAVRLATEDFVKKGKKCPVVFMLTIGNLAMRKARASFSTNFFGCAGYQIIDNAGFSTPEEGVAAALKQNANIVVICSSDEEYAQFAEPITQQIKEKNKNIIVIVAGNPTELVEKLKSAGVDDFISVRSNVLETLKKYNQKLGIS